MEILLKSMTEVPQPYDGPRYLIESTWPDDVDDTAVSPYRWIKELVPSYELIEMSQKHRWTKEHFQQAYWLELQRPQAQEALQRIFSEIDEENAFITFLYAGPTSFKTNAYYLKQYLNRYGVPDSAPAFALAA